MTDCKHHWIVEPPDPQNINAPLQGRCKRCKAKRTWPRVPDPDLKTVQAPPKDTTYVFPQTRRWDR